MKVWLKIIRPVDAEADIPLRDEASEKVRELYQKNHKDDFIFWLDEDDGTMGCIKNNRSISIKSAEAATLELQEMKPAKGRGYVSLSFISINEKELGSIHSNQNSKKAFDWLSSIQPTIASAAGLKTRSSDHGYDA